MVKKYYKLNDEKREELVKLINEQHLTIKEASRRLGIPYPNAKAVNQIYKNENRTAKKCFRFRLKCIDEGVVVEKHTLLVQKYNPYEGLPAEEISKFTCGVRKINASKYKKTNAKAAVAAQSHIDNFIKREVNKNLDKSQQIETECTQITRGCSGALFFQDLVEPIKQKAGEQFSTSLQFRDRPNPSIQIQDPHTAHIKDSNQSSRLQQQLKSPALVNQCSAQTPNSHAQQNSFASIQNYRYIPHCVPEHQIQRPLGVAISMSPRKNTQPSTFPQQPQNPMNNKNLSMDFLNNERIMDQNQQISVPSGALGLQIANKNERSIIRGQQTDHLIKTKKTKQVRRAIDSSIQTSMSSGHQVSSFNYPANLKSEEQFSRVSNATLTFNSNLRLEKQGPNGIIAQMKNDQNIMNEQIRIDHQLIANASQLNSTYSNVNLNHQTQEAFNNIATNLLPRVCGIAFIKNKIRAASTQSAAQSGPQNNTYWKIDQ